MPFWSTKLSVSPSALAKFEVIDTTAPWMSGESGSVSVRAGSTAGAAPPSVKLAEPPLVLIVGASLTTWIVRFFVARLESTEPSLTLYSTVFDGDGASLVPELYPTDRSAAW